MPGFASPRDNRITLLTEIPEMGQGTRTANVMMLADELEVEWSSIQWEQAPTIPEIYKHLITGGSGGTDSHLASQCEERERKLREMFLTAAAQQWGVEKKDCKAEKGAVIHSAEQATLAIWRVSQDCRDDSSCEPGSGAVEGCEGFLLHRQTNRARGHAGQDRRDRHLWHRCPCSRDAVCGDRTLPSLRRQVVSCDDSAAKATPGVKAVFAVPPIGFMPAIERNLNVAGGIAVVANCTWAALQGRKALKIAWDKGPGAQESTASLQEQLREKAAGPPTVVSADHGQCCPGPGRARQRKSKPIMRCPSRPTPPWSR